MTQLFDDFSVWYAASHIVVKVGVWVLGALLCFAIVKRLLKLAILVTILIVLIFALRAVLHSA